MTRNEGTKKREINERSTDMNTHKHIALTAKKKREPLYASPWLALFVVLRQELTQVFSDR